MLSLPGMEMAVLPDTEIETIKALPETDVSIKCVTPYKSVVVALTNP
jgi:uncharacterized protein YlzI (FlbEa/FlbD family)